MRVGIAFLLVAALTPAAARANGSLYSRPGPAARARHALPQARDVAAARQRRDLARQADPGLRLQRLPPRRVPLPGLPLRRPRRAGARRATRATPGPRRDTFSGPNGTYTYPTSAKYANNAADLVELRVKPLRNATAFRLTLNTMKKPGLVASTIAIGNSKQERQMPFGANTSAPAKLFLTVHGHHGGARQRGEREERRPGPEGHGLQAPPPDPGPRPALGVGPGHEEGAARGRGRPLGPHVEELPGPGHLGNRHHARRSRGPGQPVGVLQRRVPLLRAGAEDRRERRHRRAHQPLLVARPAAGRRPRRGNAEAVPRDRRLRQARRAA